MKDIISSSRQAYLYYFEDYTQKEIAQQMNVSRPTLNKLLREAREEGIVKIEIQDFRNYSRLITLENRLRARFRLKDVRLVGGMEETITKEHIARAAAGYLEMLLKSGMKVGIGWGRTLDLLPNYLLPSSGVENAEFVTLLGGSGNIDFQIHANDLTERIARNYRGSITHPLYAPICFDNESLSIGIREDPKIKKVMDMMQHLDAAFIGVDGDIDSSTTIMTCNIPNEFIDILRRENAVGNICARFFDIHGDPCARDLNERIIAISLDALKRTPLIVAVAGGRHKVKSLIGAARGGYYNILISDEATALEMLESDETRLE